MRSPVVSILFPYRNSSKFIHRSIESIREQSVNDWELIAVNDQSTDGTDQKIRNIIGSDPRVRLFNCRSSGIVPALNLAIKESRSELLIRMDSDDFMSYDRLEKQIEFLKENPDIGVVASRVKYRCNEKTAVHSGFERYVAWSNSLMEREEISFHRFEESPIVHPSVAFRKSLCELHGDYRNGLFPEDYELWLRWFSKGVEIHKLPEYLLDWYDDQNRASRIGTKYTRLGFQQIRARYLGKWLDENNLSGKSLIGWGAGKIARSQLNCLAENQIFLDRIYDVDPKKIGKLCSGVPVHSIEDFSLKSAEFMLIFCGSHDVKAEIGQFLKDKNLAHGLNYLFFG